MCVRSPHGTFYRDIFFLFTFASSSLFPPATVFSPRRSLPHRFQGPSARRALFPRIENSPLPWSTAIAIMSYPHRRCTASVPPRYVPSATPLDAPRDVFPALQNILRVYQNIRIIHLVHNLINPCHMLSCSITPLKYYDDISAHPVPIVIVALSASFFYGSTNNYNNKYNKNNSSEAILIAPSRSYFIAAARTFYSRRLFNARDTLVSTTRFRRPSPFVHIRI